tara:strand:+ start:6527 stop:6787 length:261 start_codon:yes stop_codon:yes gene_type:complete
MENINDMMSKLNKMLNNDIVHSIGAIIVILYSCQIAPNLPNALKEQASNPLVQFIVLTLIAFIANDNLTMSLLIAVGFLATKSILL